MRIVCKCGHDRAWHEHYRRDGSTDCSHIAKDPAVGISVTCACRKYRPRVRLR